MKMYYYLTHGTLHVEHYFPVSQLIPPLDVVVYEFMISFSTHLLSPRNFAIAMEPRQQKSGRA